ncbi:MAG: MFS transporter [OCS116 cluster bacterium]|nr:MFS transporter [OCS116 cluster bacterium]
MFKQIRAVLALLASAGILKFAGGLQGLLIYIRAGHEKFSTLDISLIGVGWAIGFIAGSLYMPAVVKRVGHIRAYSVMAAFGAIAILLNVLWVNPMSWVILRGISGFCFAGASMITESWLNERSTNETRGSVFSTYMIVSLATTMIGFLLVSFVAPDDDRLFLFGAILFCMALLPTALSKITQPKPLTNTKVDLKAIYANSPVAAIGCFLVGVDAGAFGGMSAAYGQELGLSTQMIAYFMMIAIFTSLFSQKPFGKLSDKMDRRYVVVGITIGAALCAFAIFWLDSRNDYVILGLMGLYGAFMYSQYPILVAHANDHAKPGSLVTVASGLLLLFGIGTIVGPVMAGLFMTQMGPSALFLSNAIVHAVLAAHTVYRVFRREAVPMEQRRKFRRMLLNRNSTPQSAVLMPKSKPIQVRDDVQ